jgi:hypothetical protein
MKFVLLVIVIMLLVLFPVMLSAQALEVASGSTLAAMTVGQQAESPPSTLEMAWDFIQSNADCRAQYVYSVTDRQSYGGYTAMFPVWEPTEKISVGIGVLGYVNNGIHIGGVGGVTLKHLVWIFDAGVGYAFPDQMVITLGINKSF